MRRIDEDAEATKSCARCGGRAFYWRTAVVAASAGASQSFPRAVAQRQPAWTCMHCGYIERHERRAHPRAS